MTIRGLYVLVNEELGIDALELCEQVLEGGADIIQFRDKRGPSKEMITKAKELKKLCGRYGVPFILNDYVDLVEEVGADGVHVGQKDMGAMDVRWRLGSSVILGVSVATVDEAYQAIVQEADYLGCGPVYSTNTKNHPFAPRKPEGLRQVVEASSIPVIAIGGIGIPQIPEVMKTGAAGIAIVSAIAHAENPQKMTRQMKEAMKGLRTGTKTT